jgi:small subunit ribosomal protein S5
MENKTPNMENKGPNMENKGPNMERPSRGPNANMENRGPNPSMENRGFQGDRPPRGPNDKKPFKKFFDKPKFRRPPLKPVSNLFSKILEINRVAATNAGGKVVSYTAFCVVGDENGSVGLGLGKAKEVNTAVEKAKTLAKKNMFKLNIKHLETIPHNVEVKYRGTRVILRKGNKGHIAGTVAKSIFKAAGLKNMVSKILGARSIKNTSYGIIEGLRQVESVSTIANRRSMPLNDLIERKRNVITYGLMRQNKNKKQ